MLVGYLRHHRLSSLFKSHSLFLVQPAGPLLPYDPLVLSSEWFLVEQLPHLKLNLSACGVALLPHHLHVLRTYHQEGHYNAVFWYLVPVPDPLTFMQALLESTPSINPGPPELAGAAHHENQCLCEIRGDF